MPASEVEQATVNHQVLDHLVNSPAGGPVSDRRGQPRTERSRAGMNEEGEPAGTGPLGLAADGTSGPGLVVILDAVGR